MKNKSLVLALALTGLALAGCGEKTSQIPDSEESESSLPSQSTPSGDTESSESSPIESSETDSDSQTSSSSQSESEVESGDSTESSDSSSSEDSTDSSSSEDSTDSSSSSSSSDSTSSSSEEPDEPVVVGDVAFDGVGNATIKAGQYFDVFEGVTAHDTNEADLTDRIVCKGHVDYGVPGSYELVYEIATSGEPAIARRTVLVESGPIPAEEARNRAYGEEKTNVLGEASYLQGGANPTVTYNNPQTGQSSIKPITRSPEATNLSNSAFNDGPVPTNTWYSGFFYGNYGGGTRAAANPLVFGANANGITMTEINRGGAESYKAAKDTVTGVEGPTMSNFTPTYADLTIKPSTLPSAPQTEVISYSENSVKLAMVDQSTGKANMVATMVQGSPFGFYEFDTNQISIALARGGVTQPFEVYDLSGNKIDWRSSSVSTGFVLHCSQKHIGYQPNWPNPGVSQPIYEEQNFIVLAPEGSSFTFAPDSGDPGHIGTITGALEGNYMSVGTLASVSETAFYAKASGTFIDSTYYSYEVDHSTNEVKTTLGYKVHVMEKEGEANPIIGLLPHQWKNSDSAIGEEHTLSTIRGTMKMTEGSEIRTTMSFAGLLPSFTKPADASFDEATMGEYLDSLLEHNTPSDEAFTEANQNFIDAPGPYWNAKAIYPLAQGLIIADQIGDEEAKADIMGILRDGLVDWWTYSGTTDERYMYYDEVAGSLIWSNDDFSTASRLSDHHFTGGYLTFASAVLSYYDPTFKEGYGEMAMTMVKDYMNYDEEDGRFPLFRTFDPYAGHSWADGKGDTSDGNNQESSGEALNSWVGGYLMGLVMEDQQAIDAAIYGFTTELEAIKQYWFNYDGDNWIDAFEDNVGAVGIVWGTKNEYQTWFGPNPEFIYGIHWLPTGEYLNSYALGSEELSILEGIYQQMREATGTGAPRVWRSYLWAIESIFDPDSAISSFDASTILSEQYPSELSLSYYMAHANKTLGSRSASDYVESGDMVAGTVYENGGSKVAVIWNPGEAKTVTVHHDGTESEVQVAANSFQTYAL